MRPRIMRTLAPLAAATAALFVSSSFGQVFSNPPEKMTFHTPESLAKKTAEAKAKADKSGTKPPAETLPAEPPGESDAPTIAQGRFLNKVVLFRNGRLLSGQILKDTAGYLFRSNGASFRCTHGEVEAVADSKSELYKYKRNRIAANDLPERFELARWCLRYQLPEEAKAETEAILAIDPQFEPARKFLKSLENPRSPFGPKQESPVDMHGDGGLSYETGGFGEDAMGQFTKRVQLILINKCGNCHANPRHESEFRLSSARGINPTVTGKNFRAAELMVDLRNPSKSKLLEMAITPHGGANVARAPFGGPNDPNYKSLRGWVFTLSRNWQEAYSDPEGLPQIAQGDLGDMPSRRPGVAPPTRKPTGVAGKMKPAPEKPGFGTAAADDAPPERPSLLNARPKKTPPAASKQPEGDPLDPSGFNDAEVGGSTRAPKSAEQAPKSPPRGGAYADQPKKSTGSSSPGDLFRDVYDGTPESWKTPSKGN
jgi:hypothetical protein